MSSRSINSFEYFSSELFLEIFCYLNGTDIYKSFYRLNFRLSKLVLIYGINYIDLCELKFDESKKILFDINSSNIYTLKVSNKYNDEFIDQLFNRNHFSLLKFSNLRLLTLDSIGLFTLHSIISQDFYFNNLQSLIIKFRSDLCHEKLLYMYKIILYQFSFRFQTLKYLHLSILNSTKSLDDINNEFSMELIEKNFSLKFLSIENICIDHPEIFLSYFPNLKKLNAIIRLHSSIFNYPLLSNLISCTLNISLFSFQSLVNLLKSCSNLKQLFISTDFSDWNLLDNDLSDDLLEDYLSNLKKFQLKIFNRSRLLNIFDDLWCKELIEEQFWLERKTKLHIIHEKSNNDEIILTEILIEFSI